MKLKGEEAFSLEPLEVTRMATVDDPIKVFSLVSLYRFVLMPRWAGRAKCWDWAEGTGGWMAVQLSCCRTISSWIQSSWLVRSGAGGSARLSVAFELCC